MFTNPKLAEFLPPMAPSCRKIKYKEPKSWKPAASIKKPLSPSTITPESPSTLSDDSEQLYFGEGEFHVEPDFLPLIKNPTKTFRRWVKTQRFIPQDLSDDFLHFFLSSSGYNMEVAMKKLQKYFHFRREPLPLFRDRDPLSPENINIFNKLYVIPLPDTTEDGRKIIVTGLMEPTKDYDYKEHIKALALVLDLLIWEQDLGFGDFEIILDGRGFQRPQLLCNELYDQKSFSDLLLDTIPAILTSFYLLYPPTYVANVADTRNGIWLTIVKSKQEMIKHVTADILPLEFGGNLGHLGDLLVQWNTHMILNRDFFIHFEKRMMNDYRRKLFYEYEISKGKNWVQQLELVEDWGYKNEYYERMKTLKPIEHQAFGALRLLNKSKEKRRVPVRNPCPRLGREELPKNYLNSVLFQKEYPVEVPNAKEEALKEYAMQCCSQPPVLELRFIYN